MNIALYGFIFLSTIINNATTDRFIKSFITYLFVIMIFELNQARQEDFIRIYVCVMTAALVINLVTIICFPDGLYYTEHMDGDSIYIVSQYWFLGFKNGIGKYCLFVLPFAALLEKDMKTKYLKLPYGKLFWINSCISLLSVLVIKSALSISAIALFVALAVLMPYIHNKKPKLFNVKIFFAIVFALFVVIVFMQNFEFLDIITNGIFGKDPETFGGRAPIWENSINRFLESPLIGHGNLTTEEYRIFLGNHAASDPHNYYLDLMIKGGIIALTIFLIVLIKCVINLNKNQYCKGNIIFTIAFTMIFSVLIAENTNNVWLWLPIAYAYNLNTKEVNIGKIKLKL